MNESERDSFDPAIDSAKVAWVATLITFALTTSIVMGVRCDGVRLLEETRVAASPDAPIVLLVDINKASVSELTDLPKIGEKLASRIVEYREENGDFLSVDELTNVRGIGPKLFEIIEPFCDVGDKDDAK